MSAPLSLSDPQMRLVTQRAEELPQPLRHSFLLRLSSRLQRNVIGGMPTNQQLSQAVDATLRELRVAG